MEMVSKKLPAIRSWGAFLLIGIVMLGACGLLLYRLGAEPFQDYDEATYAEVVAEGFQTHSFVTFTFLHLDYFNKPPLLFWLMDVSHQVIPDTEAAARAPSAISGVVLIGVLIVILYFVTGNAYGAAFGGAILATTSAFIEPARQVRFDILVSLFITLSVYAFLRAMDNRHWFLWFGAFIGLTVLTKGPLVLYALVPAGVIALVYWRFAWLLDRYFWGGVGLALLIVLPWHIYETVTYGSIFWDTYLFDQVVQRVSINLFSIGPTNTEYFEYIFQFAAPWAYAFVASIFATPFLWKRFNVQSRATLLASYAGLATVVGVCLITKTKAFSYLIPLYPFMALSITLVLYQISKLQVRGMRIFLTTTCAFLSVFGLCLSIYNGFHINPYFASEVALAQQEKSIGQLLKSEHPVIFYTYDTTTLGSVMFYSGIASPIEIDHGTNVPKGAYVLYQTSEYAKLQNLYPQKKLTTVYQGASLSLGTLDT